MAITTRINRLIEESACLNVRLADRLKGSGLDFLVWASPSSCRSPEGTKLWHPFYARKSFFIKIGIYLYILALYSFLGIVRFFSYKGFYYNCQKKGRSILLVVPDEITDHTKLIKTAYLIEDADYAVDKLLFSKSKNVGLRFCVLPYLNRARIVGKLFSATLLDFRERLHHKEINIEYIDAFIIFLRWIISQSWCFHWDFYQLIKKITDPRSSGYKAILCLHEMHFYSKVIWRVAKLRNIKGITAQHAMIIPEKLWYFPEKVELEAGLALPDIFFVFSNKIKELLQPYYLNTKFMLCCSPRFNKWRSFTIDSRRNPHSEGEGVLILFASGIMFYDTAILIRAVKNLLNRKDGADIRIRLRLHPYGNINKADKLWLNKVCRSGKVQISSNTLEKDLLEAAIVIGSNSTVIQEACILGIPVLSLSASDYISSTVFTGNSDFVIPLEAISWERIRQQINSVPDRELIDQLKADMGIFNHDLSTGLIYSSCELTKNDNGRFIYEER